MIPAILRDLERFRHIQESISLIESYLLEDPEITSQRTVDSLFYRIQIIGEASRNISDTYKTQFSDIPWRRIIATRNYLVHEYFAIHMDKIMAAVQTLPSIKPIIDDIVQQLEKQLHDQNP